MARVAACRHHHIAPPILSTSDEDVRMLTAVALTGREPSEHLMSMALAPASDRPTTSYHPRIPSCSILLHLLFMLRFL